MHLIHHYVGNWHESKKIPHAQLVLCKKEDFQIKSISQNIFRLWPVGYASRGF